MYCPINNGFCQTMQRLSERIWFDLESARLLHSPLHEESITQYNSLHLMRSHGHQNNIRQFTKAEEKKNGSDWLWLFYEPGTLRYFRVAVQAKRLYDNGKYQAFKTPQLNNLIQYSTNNQSTPIYVLYNHPKMDISSEFRQNLNSIAGGRSLNPASDLGCTFANAHDVRFLRSKAKNPKLLSKYMRPWWHLVCKCGAYQSGGGNNLDILFTSFLRLVTEFRDDDALPFKPVLAEGGVRRWLDGDVVSIEQLRNEFGLDEIDSDDPAAFSPNWVIKTEIPNDRF